MPVPAKINPDGWSADDSLFVLNNFREHLVNLQNDPIKKKAASDGIKVIDCLRFIKVNEAFISYAFKNTNDMSIYAFTDDKIKGVLRDFNNTSFHIEKYHDATKTPDECLKICLDDLKNNIKQFEDAINLMKKANKLNEFIDKLTYDEDTGCLAQRTLAAQIYAKEIETLEDSKKLTERLYFESLMNEVAAKFDPENSDKNYQMTYDFFEPYIGKWCRYGKSDEVEITYDFIVKYMIDVLREEPPTVMPGEKFYEEHMANSAADKALKLAHQEKALVKVLEAPLGNLTNLSFILNQFKDPANVRPVPRYDVQCVDRTQYWDTKEKIWRRRTINHARGLPKKPDWKYTKKTSATLLPTDSKINFFNLNDKKVGLQFNLDLCYLKNEKFVWKENQNTDSRWWVKLSSYTMPSIGLEALRQHLRDAVEKKTLLNHNEILACLCKEALTAVFATSDTVAGRLNALRVKYIIKQQLNIDLPVLVITAAKGSRIYSKKEMLQDMRFDIDNPAALSQQILASISNDPIELMKQTQQELIIEEKAAVYKINVIKLFEHYVLTKQFTAALAMLNRKEAFIIEDNQPELKKLALSVAINAKETAFAKKLLAIGADPHSAYLLTIAIQTNQQEIIDEILMKPIPKNALASALMNAILVNNTKLALAILKHEVNVANYYKVDTGESYLILALKNWNEEIIEALLAKGSDPTLKDKQNNSALSLIINSAKPNKDYFLLKAMEKLKVGEHLPVFKQLMEDSLKPDGKWKEENIVGLMNIYLSTLNNSEMRSLFQLAEDAHQYKIMAKILKTVNEHAYTDSLNSFLEQSQRHLTEEESVKLLVEIKTRFNGASSDSKNEALRLAVKSGRLLLAKQLVDMGAIPDAELFKYIIKKDHRELAIYMLDTGKVSPKVMHAMLPVLTNEQRFTPLNTTMHKSIIKTYADNISNLVNQLQQLIDPDPVIQFYGRHDPTVMINSVKKLITQLETGKLQEFSSDEIYVLKNNSRLSKIIKLYQNPEVFKVDLLKIHTKSQVDGILKSKRGTGATSAEKLENTLAAIEVDLRQQQEKLDYRLLHTSNRGNQDNINAKLNAIKLTQQHITAFKNEECNLTELIDNMSSTRDQARAIKQASTWSYLVSKIKRLFGRHYGDSVTAKTINAAVTEIKKLKQAVPAIESMSIRDSSSSVSSIEAYKPPKSLNEVKEELVALVAKDNSFASVVQKIQETIAELETNPDAPDRIVNFRKAISGLAASVTGHLASSAAAEQFNEVIYDSLIAAAVIEPINNENQDPITFADLEDIEPQSLIYLSDGYFYEIPSLVNWIKERGIMENPATRGKLLWHDQLAIIKAAKRINIDLSNLDPQRYHVQEDPAMLDAAVALALANEPGNALSAGPALQNFGYFQPVNPFMQMIADATGKTVDYWTQYKIDHPYRFTRIANAAPYIQQGFLSIDEAIVLTPEQAEDLALLTTMDSGMAPDDLAAQVNAIINSPSNLNRP